MKQKLFLLVALLSMSLIFSCSKSDSAAPESDPPDPYVSFTSVSPEKVYTSTPVTVTGTNFGTDTSKVSLTLDDQKLVITAMTNTSITFTIPQTFLKAAQKDCLLKVNVEGQDGLRRSALRQIIVYLLEPHGWFYAGTISNSRGANSQIFKNLIFPVDSMGYAQRESAIYHTSDGGISWYADGFNGGFGFGNAIASSDGQNVWVEFGNQVYTATNGGTWSLEKASFNPLICGLYTSAPGNGLIASFNGILYDINGSFAGATIKYQSTFYTDGMYQLWQKMSAIDKNNLILAGYSQNVVLEKAGVFSEVDISSVSTSKVVKSLQMVDANTAFLVNDNDELIKYVNGSWTKLAQQANAVCFTNRTTGYIAYNNKVLKTTDGGVTWSEQITLNAGDKAAAIAANNGKVWVLGNSDARGFVVKYNP